MPKKFPFLRYVLISLLLLAVAAFTVLWALPKALPPKSPPGWRIIRPPSEVSALALDGEFLWAGGQEGVYKLERKTGAVLSKLESNAPLTYVKALLVDKSGLLWIGHQRGLTSYDGKALRHYTVKDGLPDERVNALMEDRQGRLWVGTWKGAAMRESEGWRVLNAANGLTNDMVNVMLQDNQGGIWFGSYVAPHGGISYFKDGKRQYFSARDGLPHNNISSIIQDQEGSIWAGGGLLERGGAAQLVQQEGRWSIKKTLGKKDGLAGEKVRSLFQDRDGVLWFGSEYDGLAFLKEGRWGVLREKDGLSNPEIKVMLQDEEGALWIGTRDGVTGISARALTEIK